MMSMSWATPPMIAAPLAGCCFITSNSSSLSAPGLRRMRSSMPILPTSCNSALMRNLRISALLHDVGKIGIDDRILRKPGALSDDEFEVMKQHPAKGAAIMGGVAQLIDIIPGMKYHHEKWSGGGYPDNMKEEQIPMQARIIAIADTFDAMTTNRPYQKAMELSYVVEKVKSFAGSRFDPKVVEAFVIAVKRGDIVI